MEKFQLDELNGCEKVVLYGAGNRAKLLARQIIIKFGIDSS